MKAKDNNLTFKKKKEEKLLGTKTFARPSFHLDDIFLTLPKSKPIMWLLPVQ